MRVSAEALEARIEAGDEGRLVVRAPKVGLWLDPPRAGQLVGPGTSIGRLVRLTRGFDLRLPPGASGRVVRIGSVARVVPVEYGQVLFELEPATPRGAEDPPPATGPHAESSRAGGARAEELVVRAPTDGVFYARPAPDAQPFVTPGRRVRHGQPVGLVEVMKTFNLVVYGGPGQPEEAEVVEVRAAQASEVAAGDVLVVLRATGASG